MNTQETTVEKVGKLLSLADCPDCFAVPGANSIIDVLHPATGRTVCFNKSLEEIRAERPEYAGAVKMTVEQHCREKAERQHTPITWAETTAAQFNEMLEVLPPALMAGRGFLVGEPWDHDAETAEPRFAAYRETAGGRFEVASRPMTRREFRKAVIA